MAESTPNPKRARIFYARVDEFARKEDKYRFLDDARSINGVEWQELQPDAKHTWLTEGMHAEFDSFIPVGDKETKSGHGESAIFATYSIGVNTNRDVWAYNFDRNELAANITLHIETYNEQTYKWHASRGKPKKIDSFVLNDDTKIKWSSRLKECLLANKSTNYSPENVRASLYRPFTSQYLYFDEVLNHRQGRFPDIFPTALTENQVMCIGGYGRKEFAVLMSNKIPDLNFYADPAQCFPFYTYNEDGTNRRENITDWALAQFRAQYKDESISKLDIFHYVYALLHHPAYRTTYAANLKRELPRIPFVKSLADFRAFVSAGARLADLHVNYEAQPEYPLVRVEEETAALDWRVERMRLSKDKSSIVYNDFLTLKGIPGEAFEYRLGNRSALEWVIDQYQVSTDRRSGITNDPNRDDDPEYIVRLIGKVTTVSVETVKVVRALPELQLS